MLVFDEKSIKKLGKRLKTLRESKGISLNMFAYENDMTTATVSRVENGLVNPTFATLAKYAMALEISIGEMLDNIDYAIEVDDSWER